MIVFHYNRGMLAP